MKFWSNTSQRPAREVQAQFSEVTPCKGHILLVEDNPRVLSATEIFLRDTGYEVTTAASLTEALEQVRAHPEIDLLMTDYHLGNQETGKQLISAAREIRGSSFKILVITGDTSAAVHAFDGDACLCWLLKPFKPRQLTTLLEHLLTQRGDAEHS